MRVLTLFFSKKIQIVNTVFVIGVIFVSYVIRNKRYSNYILTKTQENESLFPTSLLKIELFEKNMA